MCIRDRLLAETPRSVQDLLRANVAGLNVGFAASAKGSTGFEIRGKNTLKAGSEPLIVIDGVIYEGDLTDINPMDIASVDVLKDASSAAVYGAKAANGVIVILTQKGGKGGKPLISFNTTVGVATCLLYTSTHWPTYLSLADFRRSTLLTTYPDYLKKYVKGDTLAVLGNGTINYRVKDIHVGVKVLWNYEAPEGGGDSYSSFVKGTKASFKTVQDKFHNYIKELYICLLYTSRCV